MRPILPRLDFFLPYCCDGKDAFRLKNLLSEFAWESFILQENP